MDVLLSSKRCPAYLWGSSLAVLALLTLLLSGCSNEGSSGQLTPPSERVPQLEQQAVRNLVESYRTALVQEDIDRLDALLAAGDLPVPAQAGTWMTASHFRDLLTTTFMTHANPDIQIPPAAIQVDPERRQVTFTEIDSALEMATLRQQTQIFRLTLQWQADTTPGVTTLRIAAVQRTGPVVQVSTTGQLLAATPAQIEVQAPELDVASITLTVPESGAVHTLMPTVEHFQGTFTPPPGARPQPVAVRVQTRSGEVMTLSHPYQQRVPGEGVIERLGGTAGRRFFALTVAPDQTVWAGGESGGTLYQVAPDATAATVVGRVFAPDAPDPGRITDLLFDRRGRLHVVAFSPRASGDFILQATTPPTLCQTVDVLNAAYPFQAPRSPGGPLGPSASTRAIAADAGDIWLFGSEGGVARVADDLDNGLCPAGEAVLQYEPLYRRANSALPSNAVQALVVARDGALWFGTALGLVRLNNGQFTAVPFATGLRLQGNAETLEAFFAEVAAAIAAAQPLTSVGIGNVSFVDTFGAPLIKEDLIFSAVEDGQGRLWVGTLGGGVRRIAIQQGTPQQEGHLTRADGLVSNIIFALAVAPDGAIWAATNKGVSRIDAASNALTTFSALDGLALPVRDLAIDAAGAVWLATDDGIFRLRADAGQIRGVVQDDTGRPVAGAQVTVVGTTLGTVTDGDGGFRLPNVPLGRQRLRIAGQAVTGGPLITVQREVEITTTTDDILVVIVPQAPAVPFDPGQGGQIAFPGVPQAALDILPGTAQVPVGVEPALRLTLLPLSALSSPLPTGFQAGAAAVLAPEGITFSAPVQLTLPNQAALPAGQLVDLLQLRDATLTYEPVGFGQVSADGTVITTLSSTLSTLSSVVFAVTPRSAQTTFTVVSGAEQSGVVGTTLTTPLAVAVRDGNGQGIPGVPVTFTVNTGGGRIIPDAVVRSDIQGQARVQFTLGSVVGQQRVSVSIAGLPELVITATAEARQPGRLVLVSGNGQTGSVGTLLPLPLIIIVQDDTGQPVADVAVTFEVTGGGSLMPPPPVQSDPQGQVAVRLTLGNQPGEQQVLARVSGLEPVLFTAIATVGAPASITIDGENALRAQVGTTVPLGVSIRDRLGNPVPDVLVTWTVVAGSGTLNPERSRSNAQGQAATAVTLGLVAGLNRLEARLANPLLSATITITGEADQSTARLRRVAGNNQSLAPGETLPIPFVMRMEDQFGNPVVGVEITAVVLRGNGTLEPAPVAPLQPLASRLGGSALALQAVTPGEAIQVTDTQGEVRFSLLTGASDTDIVVEMSAQALSQVAPVQFLTIVGMVDITDLPLDLAVAGETIYVAAGASGLQVIAGRDPVRPQIVQTLDLAGVTFSVALTEDRLYVATFTPTALYVFDRRNPLQPVQLNDADPPLAQELTPVHLVPQGTRLYIALEDRSAGTGTLQVVDVAQPATPTILSTLQLPDRPTGLTVVNDFAYLPTTASGLLVVDVRDAAHPALALDSSLLTLAAPSGISSAGQTAYVIEDTGRQLQLRVLDLSHPGVPALRGAAPLPVIAIPFTASTIAVAGDFVYVASFDLGLQVFDSHFPDAPRFVGGIDTPSVAFNTAAVPDATGSRIYITDLAVGLSIVAGPPLERVDTDGDGVIDFFDAFPINPDERLDTDRDGIGNNADSDDDNDTFPDTEEQQTDPLNPRDMPVAFPVLDATSTLFVDAAAPDQRGNGSVSAPYRSLQAALRAVRMLRDSGFTAALTIAIQPGIYSAFHTMEAFPLFLNQSGVTLRGAGTTQTIIDAAFFADVLDIAAGDITVEGLTLQQGINGSVTNAGGTEAVVFQDVRMRQNLFLGLSVGGGVPVVVRESEMTDNGSRGLEIFNDSAATITTNTIRQNATAGIFLFRASALLEDNLIMHNATHGVQIDQDASATLRDNIIQGNGARGLLVSRTSTASIQGNRLLENGDGGVTIQSGSDATILGNEIMANGNTITNHGIQVSSGSTATITDNDVQDHPGAGILVANAGSSSTITANRVHDNIVGINVLQSATATLADNTVQNNRQDGVLLASNAECTLLGNRLQSNGDSGIRLQQAAFATIDGATITGNALHGIALFGASVAVVGSDEGVVTLSRNGGFGIFVNDDESVVFLERRRVIFDDNEMGDFSGNVVE